MASVEAACGKCGKPATGAVILTAMGKKWHKECFTCTSCGTTIAGAQFFNIDGSAYCAACAEKATAPPPVLYAARVKCKACDREIEGTFTKAYGFNWHDACFVCAHCKKPISNDGLFDDDVNKPVHLACLK